MPEDDHPKSLADAIRQKARGKTSEVFTFIPGEAHGDKSKESEFMRKIEDVRKHAVEQEPANFQRNLMLIREREKVVLSQLRTEVDFSTLHHANAKTTEQIRERVRDIVAKDPALLSQPEKGRLLQDVLDELFGFGPLSCLLRDPTITGIHVNQPNRVFVERNGSLEQVDVAFENEEHLKHTLEKAVYKSRAPIDATNPMVTAQLPNGSRVEAIVPPVSLDGPVLSIRCYGLVIPSLGSLAERGMLSLPMAALLRSYVKGRCNIIISGGSGSGRSTLLNAMSAHILPNERVMTLEDSAGLRLQTKDWVRLQWVPPDSEGKNEVTKSAIITRALRMRPDRLIVAECSGAEGYEFLQGVNSGRSGDMAITTAGSVKDCLRRFERMVRLGDPGIPPQHARELIAGTVHVLIHMRRLPGGTLCINEIAEMRGLKGEEFEVGTICRLHTDGPDPSIVESYHWITVEQPTLAYQIEAHATKQDIDGF